ncbi:MAG: 30S ribosomal protein S3 [Planctomycetota bacterium]|nr:MAG: 30S ribosomal protein S3 [Planctomycetota bacterium]
MGQKVHPIGFRLGITEQHRSRWYATKHEFGDLLVEDQKIRRHIHKQFRFTGIAKIEIERAAGTVKVIIHSAKPGLIYGKKQARVEKLREDLFKLTGGREVAIEVREVKRPELSAQVVAESIAEQLEKRSSFRRTIKRALELTMSAGAKGCKVMVSGRLGGAEMARRETQMQGSIPLSTLRAKIDYGFAKAVASYGSMGVKVWIYLGEEFSEDDRHGAHAQARQAP